MTNPPGLSDADRSDIHARLASWFGDEHQAFLVSHLAPVIDRIKADGYIAGLAEGVEVRVREFQQKALEMARKADQAERRAEDAEAEVERLQARGDRHYAAFVGAEARLERLKAAADTVGHQAACMVDPCDCWMQDLAPLLEYERPWGRVGQGVQGAGADAWEVSVYRELECDHQWLDRPESDTSVCELCGMEH